MWPPKFRRNTSKPDSHPPLPADMRPRTVCCLSAFLLASGCEVQEQIQERYRDVTSHERYAASLLAAGLDGSAVGRDWSVQATRALEQPLGIELPHREAGYLDPNEPGVVAYRFALQRGQRLRVDLTASAEEARWFVDLFRVPNDSTATPYHEVGLDEGARVLEYDVPRTGDFVLRIQPELLRGGQFEVDVRVMPSLAFPVEGRGPSAILSGWGAPRDGGRRRHRGVDIFAPRGTPALAAAAGRVTRVDTTDVGGLVVWVREDRNRHNLYYAHLSRLLVREGQLVAPGDTVGLVGNTGNARTTPPHLHFGIYRRGAVDPYPFIEPQDTVLSALEDQAVQLVGSWARALTDDVVVRSHARTRNTTELARLGRGAALEVLAASTRFLRVRTPEGVEGYTFRRGLVSAADALWVLNPDRGTPLHVAPRGDADVRQHLTGEEVAVVGLHADYGLVRASDGTTGWLALEENAGLP